VQGVARPLTFSQLRLWAAVAHTRGRVQGGGQDSSGSSSSGRVGQLGNLKEEEEVVV
jgi:hypothetical protein